VITKLFQNKLKLDYIWHYFLNNNDEHIFHKCMHLIDILFIQFFFKFLICPICFVIESKMVLNVKPHTLTCNCEFHDMT
jgi:hypothetical protein